MTAGLTQWLADLKIEYVIAAIIVLFLARLWLGRYKTPVGKSAAEIVESALIAIVLVFLVIKPFVIQAFFIPSGSMEPTLLEDDHILVNKFIYRVREPRRGDIIVFKAPEAATGTNEEKAYIKRLVGLPGDMIEIKDGAVYRNAERLDETSFIKRTIDRKAIDYNMKPVRVPDGHLFVLGDNRTDSSDSHKWGTFERSRVLGKAMCIFWPLGRAQVLRSESGVVAKKDPGKRANAVSADFTKKAVIH